MKDISKHCADQLRAFSLNYGVKLKATHAHELIAAFFGYKSRAAHLADIKYPISNLPQATHVVLPPTAPIDQRRSTLTDLPSKLPDTYSLSETVFTCLLAEKLLVITPWPTYEELAKFLADDYLRQHQMEKFYRNPVGEGIKIESVENGIRLIVLRFYQIPTQVIFEAPVYEANITTTIWLQRIAGHIGYAKPEVSIQIDPLSKQVQL